MDNREQINRQKFKEAVQAQQRARKLQRDYLQGLNEFYRLKNQNLSKQLLKQA